MRTFFCIPLGTAVAAAVAGIARAVREQVGMRARWVPDENYHLTLRFLGEIEPELTVELEERARRVAAGIAPFVVTLDRVGCFPSMRRPRVLWVGGDAGPVYRGLAMSLRHELERLGFPPDRKPLSAHVTLARIKDRPDPRLAAIVDAASDDDRLPLHVHADRICLMESVLGREGARYLPLFSVPLAGSELVR